MGLIVFYRKTIKALMDHAAAAYQNVLTYKYTREICVELLASTADAASDKMFAFAHVFIAVPACNRTVLRALLFVASCVTVTLSESVTPQ